MHHGPDTEDARWREGGRCVRRGGLGALLSVLLLGVLSGCGGGGPQPVLRVAGRLLVPESSPTAATPDRCQLGGDSRRAIGCLGRVDASGLEEARDGGRGTITYRLPLSDWSAEFILERAVRADADGPWKEWPRILWRGRRGRLEVPFAFSPGSEARLLLRKVKPTTIDLQSKPRKVAAASRLVGEIGLQTLLEKSGGPVRFRIEAEIGDRVEPIFERIVDPLADGDRWLAYQIDLAAFAGQEVSFHFVSEPVEGAPRRPGRSFASWSLPRVLEWAEVAPDEIRDVLVLSLDTLRADYVGVYGSRLPTTPHLDAFAQDATLFETAQTTFPSTTASHMSLFTGLYPRVHGVLRPGLSLSPRVTTLPEMLAGAGFATAAVTENGMVAAHAGFNRGFDSYREFRGRTARDTAGHIEEVVDAGLGWLAAHPDEQVFLFLHTYQVHGPYGPPPEFDRFESKEAGLGAFERDRRAYAGEVLYADSQFQRLLDGIDELGRLDSMAILVTADHGEGFGEHSIGHGNTLHEEEIRIPMLLRVPGWKSARRGAPVSLVDVVPTLLELLGIEVDVPAQGRSLVPLARSADAPGFRDRAIYAEQGRQGEVVAVRTADHKWILGPRKGGPVRFEIVADPREQQGVTAPDALAPGQAWARAYEEDAKRVKAILSGAAPVTVPVGDETQAELRALGYLE
jgi:arylsulfatase A-like enzyme